MGRSMTTGPLAGNAYCSQTVVSSQWIKNLRTDIYLDESVKVIDDMIVQDNLVYVNRK